MTLVLNRLDYIVFPLAHSADEIKKSFEILFTACDAMPFSFGHNKSVFTTSSQNKASTVFFLLMPHNHFPTLQLCIS